MVTAFQLDECDDYASYSKRCNKAGLAQLRRYKTKNKGTLDPQVIERCVKTNGTLLTTDGVFFSDNEQDIPERNPGFIVVEHSEAIPYTITQDSIEKILEDFKASFPDWSNISWKNSLVKISDAYIEIGRKTASGINFGFRADWTDENWQDGVRSALAGNAAEAE
jgi:hypothetical protein